MSDNTATPDTPYYRVLLCASGMSPAIITETLYALITRPDPFWPDEIHIVSTTQGCRALQRELLQPRLDAHGQPQPTPVQALLADYWPADRPPPRWGADTLHPIQDFDDINSPAAHQAAGDTLFHTYWQLQRGHPLQRSGSAAQWPVQIHASIAGGRKTMSFLMGHVFSLLAQPQDQLSHVLVNPPFEHVQPPFYFKPRQPQTVTYQPHNQPAQTLSTAQAHIELGLIPALQLGQATWMPQHWRNDTTPTPAMSLSRAVRLFNAQNQPEPLVLRVAHPPRSTQLQGQVQLCGITIDLTYMAFAWLVIYALIKQNPQAFQQRKGLHPAELPAAFWLDLPWADYVGRRHTGQPPHFASARSNLDTALHHHIGPAARHYRIASEGSTRKPYRLVTPAHLIKFDDGAEPEWEMTWVNCLKKHLRPAR